MSKNLIKPNQLPHLLSFFEINTSAILPQLCKIFHISRSPKLFKKCEKKYVVTFHGLIIPLFILHSAMMFALDSGRVPSYGRIESPENTLITKKEERERVHFC